MFAQAPSPRPASRTAPGSTRPSSCQTLSSAAAKKWMFAMSVTKRTGGSPWYRPAAYSASQAAEALVLTQPSLGRALSGCRGSSPVSTVADMETTVTVGADKIWAEDSEGSGPVVVLLHQGVGDSRQWDRVWPALTSSCRVIRYDVRAYGRSPAATQEYTLAGDLWRVLDHFQLARAHLVGCSMGGGTAIELALADPGRAQSLTLLCPGISGYPWPEEPELEAEFEALAAAGGEDAIVQGYQRLWAAAGAEPEVMDQLRSAVRAEPNEEQYQRQGQPAFDRLHELSVPTVLLVGDLDRPVLIASNEEAARRIPGCQLIWMPGVDHMPALRDPDLISRTVLAQVQGGSVARDAWTGQS